MANCNRCKKSPCGCKKSGSGLSASDQAQLADMQDTIDAIAGAVGVFLCGHPILMVENADDVDQFDLSTGLGRNCWEGWGICNGAKYYNAKLKKNIPSPNLTDRFIVGAGGAYAVDAVGGSDTVALTVAEMPEHTHGVTDPGHTHIVTDPGHTHGTNQSPHTHAGTGSPIGPVTGTTDNPGNHNHQYGSSTHDFNTGVNIFANDKSYHLSDGANANTTPDGAHTHVVTVTPFTVALNIVAASISIVVQDAFTGISNDPADTDITIDNEGSGDAHENRPPYFALLFAMKI